MLKQRIIKVYFFTVMIAIHLCLNSLVLAEDCADEKDVTQTPTPPGNAEYLEPWREQYRPTIYASSETIAAEIQVVLPVRLIHGQYQEKDTLFRTMTAIKSPITI